MVGSAFMGVVVLGGHRSRPRVCQASHGLSGRKCVTWPSSPSPIIMDISSVRMKSTPSILLFGSCKGGGGGYYCGMGFDPLYLPAAAARAWIPTIPAWVSLLLAGFVEVLIASKLANFSYPLLLPPYTHTIFCGVSGWGCRP